MSADNSSPVTRVGVIGCGRVAQQRHLPMIAELAGAELVAVSDVNAETRSKLAEQYGLKETYEDFRDLVASDSVDAVMVAAPTEFHAEAGLAALNAGKHVMIEKPVAVSLDEVESLEAAAEASGKTAAVAMNSRWHRLTRRAREVVRSGSLGRIGLLSSTFTDDFRLYGKMPEWTMNHAQAGCVLVETAVHHFDLWQFILDSPVEEIFAKMKDPMSVQERAVVTATMANGVIVSGVFTEGLKGANKLELFGEEGRLQVSVYDFDGFDHSPRSEWPGTMKARLRRVKQSLAEFPGALKRQRSGGDWAGSYRSEWQNFLDAIRDGGQPECGLAEGKRALQVGLAAMGSLASGGPVRIADAPREILPYNGE